MAPGATEMEVKQVEQPTLPIPDSGGRLSSKSELASLANSSKWLTIAKNSETVFAAVDYSSAREELRSTIEVKGEILPSSHEFTQLIQMVSQRLGIPDQTELAALDTEEADAYFDPNSRTMVFTRGLARYFLDNGLELSEDHIAAVLAHELEHAQVLGEDYVARVKSSFSERLKNVQHHAEEYRADAEAMRRLSKAGYNPKAVIEILRAFGLTSGRSDLGHPEEIDRIRKLEDRLADDEHPLSHTTKEPTPLEKDIINWLSQDSVIYDQTEKLLHSSTGELAQSLQSAETQQQFWDIYRLKRNVDRVAAAKALLRQEDQNLERLAVKLLIHQAFYSNDPFVEGKSTKLDAMLVKSLASEYGGISAEERSLMSQTMEPFFLANKIPPLFKSSGFRDEVATEIPTGLPIITLPAEISEVERIVDTAIRERFNLLSTKTLSEDEQKFYTELRGCYQTGQINSDLLLTIYSSLDLKHQTALHQEASQRYQARGLRDSEKSTVGLIDLRNATGRDQIMAQIKFALASSFVKVPQVSDEDIKILGSTIAHDTGLNAQEVGILATTILKSETAHSWVDYLQTQNKDSLKRIIQGVKFLEERESELRFSPIRSFHQSYLACANQMSSTERWRSFASAGDYGLDASGLRAIRMLAAREFYLKGYPQGFRYDFYHRLPPGQINLTMEEWDLAVEGHANYTMADERAEWALVRYIDQIKQGVINPELTEYAQKYAGVSNSTSLSIEQIQAMMDHSLWEPDRLQRMVFKTIQNWTEARKFPEGKPDVYFPDFKLPHLSQQDRKEILSILRNAYKIFKDNPIDSKQVKKHYYEERPRPEQIGSLLLDVLIQDIEATSIPIKEATLQALRQLTAEGVLLNYDSISAETISNIGLFTDNDIDTLIQELKNNPSLSANEQDLIENFKLLRLVAESDRVDLARTPGSESSIKAILSNQGNEAVNWVIQNFSSSNQRDIILIGLYEFATDDQKAHFDPQIQTNLTEHPDIFGGKRTANFEFDIYYRDVKVDKESGERFKGEGRLAKNFDDLLRRRHPFSTLGFRSHSAASQIYNGLRTGAEKYGSIYQTYLADRLLKNEEIIFNRNLPFDQRVQSLTDAAPYKSIVRDIHLEMLLQDELQQLQADEDKVQVGRALLPLFTAKSSLKSPLAVEVFKAELTTNPDLVRNFNGFITLLTQYMPEPSLSRNYFLNQFENASPLTIDQLKQLNALRMSSEGKKAEDDSAPMTFVMNKLGELNREEKIKTMLWLLNMGSEKPKAVLQMERTFDGHLNSLPAAIAMSTEDEKEVIYKRFLLGAEGIVDLEAVKPEQLDAASAQRRRFIQVLSERLLPDSMPKAGLFRNIFATIIDSSDPAHATRILIKLINKFTEAGVQGKQLPPEEVIALGLNELGVVGKKVSQSLAELDWVPDSYKKTLRRSQAEGEVVPKRALMMIAEDAGLLNENAPIRIVSFDQLAGAASNKQAISLTIEVNDGSVGLPRGLHKVIGKFKRPSAQKTENINHDLKVLRNILNVLNQQGYAEALPRDFSAQISDAVTKELDFPKEKQFSEELRTDLLERNTKRKQKVAIPRIYFTSEDVMLESVAPGISLRAYRDLREQGSEQLIASGYGALSERVINQTIVTEALSELITTGKIHSDLHPGNIFVDQQSNLTIIDLGMHQRLTQQQRFATISLVAGLASGNEAYLKRTLQGLGWNLGDTPLGLTRFNFADNTMRLLRVSQKAQTAPPEILTSVILATSKLTTYTSGFTNAELFRMLVGTLNKREAPKILAHLVKSGLGTILR